MKILKTHDKSIPNGFNLHSRRFLSGTVSAVVDTPELENGVCVSHLQSVLQNCARERNPLLGKSCHGQILQFGLQRDVITSNMLINTYSKCGFLGYARRVFDEMPEPSLVSWNTMIGSYTQNGNEEEALNFFKQMRKLGTPFSEFTVSSVLCACAAKSAVVECKQLHALVLKTAMESNAFVGTALLDVYAKCCFMEDARGVFDSMPERSPVTWSSLMAGYVQSGNYDEALISYNRARGIGVEDNQFAISSALCACAGLTILLEGNQVHAVLQKAGFGSNMHVLSSLIDMYSKCGGIEEASLVFADAEKRNVVLWNAMISGFSKHARVIEAMILFEKMQQVGIFPNELTYISVLSACSHMGLVERGRRYFDLMLKNQIVSPNVLHYSCMVDIYGRAGGTDEALNFINSMPFDATASMWGSLLASCRVHGNLEVAEVAAKKLFEIEPDNAGNHVLLSNIYAANKRWDEVSRARKLLKDSEVKKERGKSWIEYGGKIHTFMVGERCHPRISEVYLKLELLLENMDQMDYECKAEYDHHDVEESRKQQLLRHHSEKLAFAFALLCLPADVPIRIMKNLRICGDCHSFMKVASRTTGRKVIVRDNNRFHHFRDGFCSCGDFW